MPPLPMSSRISSCGNNGASSATVGGLNGGCFASVIVSAAAPILSRQAGQRPASAPGESGVPHCGHLLASGIGGLIFTVSMPPSEAKPAGRYRKFWETSNAQHPLERTPTSLDVRCWALVVGCFPRISPQLKAALENHFRRHDHQKNPTNECIQPEERHVDPVQAAAARNPMFQREAAEDDEPADEIRDAEMAEQPEREQHSAYRHVREKRRLQSVLRPPRDDERTQAVCFVELVILQRVNDVEADEPQHDGQCENDWLHTDTCMSNPSPKIFR